MQRQAVVASVKRYLAQRTRFGMKFGLETMRALAAELAHPERAFRCLLIAGTNGKGSVAAYCDAVLRASGLRVGRYTSPHLVRVNERITVGGREISDPAFARAVSEVRQAAVRCIKKGTLQAHPTFFEAVTAAAFVHFRRARVDIAVLEVGLGGRLDATNISEPIASAIVSIDLDHEMYLGKTLEAIAREKAGIVRRGRTTVLGPMPDAARRAIRDAAKETGARTIVATRGVRVRSLAGLLDVETPRHRYRSLRPLPGRHQRDNLLVALRLLEAAAEAGVHVDLSAGPAAIARTRWPGRLETIPGRPALVLDGAHNPAGARALAAHLRNGPPFVLVFGAMADKDVRGLAEELFPLASAIVLTRPPIARAALPAAIAKHAGRLAAGAIEERSVARALSRARRLALAQGREARVVVAGSLYLVGAVKALLARQCRR